MKNYLPIWNYLSKEIEYKMIRHFFLDKTNTIIENSKQNLGLNPILHIGYGNSIMRGLIHFDINPIKKLIEDKTFADTDKLKFSLRMTNCFSINGYQKEDNVLMGFQSNGKRACSFDLMLMKLPCDFDSGRGFEFINDFWVGNEKSMSADGSNWFNAKSEIPWNEGGVVTSANTTVSGGVYSMEYILSEYEKYTNGENSIILGEQHFDYGDEPLSIDITKYIFDCIKCGHNYGLCLSFTPRFENTILDTEEYVGFYTDLTNTFFHPFVEAYYDEYIEDDRNHVSDRRKNRIYLYVTDDGIFKNLDGMPSLEINGYEIDVKQSTKGVYYGEFSTVEASLEEDTTYYDKWSKIALNGAKIEDVELEFNTVSKSQRLSIGDNSVQKDLLVPFVYGINDDEKLNRGEVREVNVEFKRKFSSYVDTLVSAEYRLYVKDGNREIDVIPYHKIERANENNFFLIHTEDLIPHEYFIDIKVETTRGKNVFKKSLCFKVLSDITEKFR